MNRLIKQSASVIIRKVIKHTQIEMRICSLNSVRQILFSRFCSADSVQQILFKAPGFECNCWWKPGDPMELSRITYPLAETLPKLCPERAGEFAKWLRRTLWWRVATIQGNYIALIVISVKWLHSRASWEHPFWTSFWRTFCSTSRPVELAGRFVRLSRSKGRKLQNSLHTTVVESLL